MTRVREHGLITRVDASTAMRAPSLSLLECVQYAGRAGAGPAVGERSRRECE